MSTTHHMSITLQAFAAAKDYMPPILQIEQSSFSSLKELRAYLIKQFPEGKDVWLASRFALQQTFVDDEYILKNNDYVFIVPPSSGG